MPARNIDCHSRWQMFLEMAGNKVKDFVAITQVGATIKLVLDEINEHNLAMFTLGEQSIDTGGNAIIAPFKKTEIAGVIKVEGTNDIGQHVDYQGRVSVNPSGDFKFITDADDFSRLEISLECQKDTSNSSAPFGVFTVHQSVTA